MRLVKFTHTDGRDAYVAPGHVTAVMPPKSTSPGPDALPGGGPGAILHLTCGYEVLVVEDVEEARRRLEASGI
jgi:hypothetical protein